MSENQRIRLSKKMLKDSLIRLLHKEGIHKISVRDICAGAQINRTTFYKYYGSQYDLLQDMENDVLTRIENYLSEHNRHRNDSLQQLVQVFVFINENLELCRTLLNNNIDPQFPEKVFSLPAIRQHVVHLMTECGEEDAAYMFDFVVNGGYRVVIRWMNKENRESPEEIAALLNRTIMRLFPM